MKILFLADFGGAVPLYSGKKYRPLLLKHWGHLCFGSRVISLAFFLQHYTAAMKRFHPPSIASSTISYMTCLFQGSSSSSHLDQHMKHVVSLRHKGIIQLRDVLDTLDLVQSIYTGFIFSTNHLICSNIIYCEWVAVGLASLWHSEVNLRMPLKWSSPFPSLWSSFSISWTFLSLCLRLSVSFCCVKHLKCNLMA